MARRQSSDASDQGLTSAARLLAAGIAPSESTATWVPHTSTAAAPGVAAGDEVSGDVGEEVGADDADARAAPWPEARPQAAPGARPRAGSESSAHARPVVPGPAREEVGHAFGLRGWLADRLPLGVRRGRLDPGMPGVAVLALVALVGAAVAVALALRARPQPLTAADPAVTAATATPATARDPVVATPEPTPTPAPIVVDVAGLVARPGVVSLPAGSRVADAVEAAGGLQPGADTLGLSLARRLVDGEKVFVGIPAPPGTVTGAMGPSASATPDLVDVNTADEKEFDTLPGVGPVLAGNAVRYRQEHGPFTSVEQLRSIPGWTSRTMEQVRGRVRL